MKDDRPDIVRGAVQVGVNETFEVVVNIPEDPSQGLQSQHLVFSPNQARIFAETLREKAKEAQDGWLAAARAVHAEKGGVC